MPMLLQEHECQKIFRDFYRGASNWLQTAQELMRFIDGKAEGEMTDGSDSAGEAKVFYDTIVTPAFFASDGGKSCSSIVSTIAAECSALTSGVKTASGDEQARFLVVPFESVATAAAEAEGGGGRRGNGPFVGGNNNNSGGPRGPVVWAAAEVPGTNLHMTLVPPPKSRSENSTVDQERREVLQRLKTLRGAKLIISVSKYHLAEEHVEGSSGGGKKQQRHARGGRWSRGDDGGGKRIGFWEVDAVESAEPHKWSMGSEMHFSAQQPCYHITDVGSLANHATPKMAFEVMSDCVRNENLRPTIVPKKKRSVAAVDGAIGVPAPPPQQQQNAVDTEEEQKRSARRKRFSAPQAQPPQSPTATDDANATVKGEVSPSVEESQASESQQERDQRYMRKAIELSRMAAAQGNLPFGAVAVDMVTGKVLAEAQNEIGSHEAEGTATTDVTASAETLLVRRLCTGKVLGGSGSAGECGSNSMEPSAKDEGGGGAASLQVRTRCTVYSSTEPNVMGVGALVCGGVGRVVYGCRAAKLAAEQQKQKEEQPSSSSSQPGAGFYVPIRELLAQAPGRAMAIGGPLLEDEALAVHREFPWYDPSKAPLQTKSKSHVSTTAPGSQELGKRGKASGGFVQQNEAACAEDGEPSAVIYGGENWTVRTFSTGPMQIEASIVLH